MKNKKQIKAQLTNEIAKRYQSRIKELEESRNALRNKIEIERQQYRELQSKYLKLAEKVESLKDWNNRLMEYFNLDEDSQKEYFKEFKSKADFAKALDQLVRMSNVMFGTY